MRSNKPKQLSTFSRVVIFTAFYVVAGYLGRGAYFEAGKVALVLPAAGIALAAILLFGDRFWPGIAAGAVVFAYISGEPLGLYTLGPVLGNTMGALVCAYLLNRFVKFRPQMERVRDVVGFVGLACILGTTINATFNAVTDWYQGVVAVDELFQATIAHWVPNGLAELVITPVILTWGSKSFIQWNYKLAAEAVACAIGLLVGTHLSFNTWMAHGIASYPMAYLPYPFLIWGALRFGQRGATAGTLLVAAMAIYALLDERGPFYTSRMNDSLMLLGSYIGILGTTNMLLAAAATERRVAEEASRKSEAMFLLISENVGDMIAVTDAEGKRLYNSPYYAKVFGIPTGELQGSDAFGQIHPEDREKVRHVFEQTIESGMGQRLEYRFLLADGSVRYIESLGNYVPGDHGDLGKLVSISRDITDRKRDEESLRLLASAVEFADDSIVITTADLEEPKIVFVNPAFTNMSGYTAAEAIGKTPRILEGPKTDSAVLARLRENLSRGQIFHGEAINYRKDGTEFYKEWHIEPIKNLKGETTHYLTIERDITQRKQIEEDLARARDAALEAARLKAEFLANMSHEIRTPMNGVIGMTNLLLKTELNKQQKEFAKTIRSSADSLLTLINDILDFSKIEAGKLTFEILDFDLLDALHGTMDLVAEKAHAKGIELAGFAQPDVTTLLRGDPGRLRQILTNLVGNAIKFTQQGEVVVLVSKQHETPTHIKLRFSVTDSGIGIPLEAQPRLFHAFSQADGSTTRKFGGTGLGLAISKQLVELMHGEIGLQSRPGKGSTFWFTVLLEKQPPREPALSARPNLGSLRVLVVDDNATNRHILETQLSSWKMRTVTASNAREAMELLRAEAERNNSFDVAVLDMSMPDMDGLALAESIKADPSISKTRLVLLITYGEKLDAQRVAAAGIEETLLKPVRPSSLFDCLATIMGAPSTSMEQSEKTAASAAPSRPDVRILVAEDNIINQQVAIGQLQELGYTADVVANGLEVLEAIGLIPYDIILMDCQMPEMDGFESTTTIRQREHERQLKGIPTTPLHIIAMTANAMQGDRERCLAAGMNDYITKPVEVEDLQAALERWRPPGKTTPAQVPPVDMKRLQRVTGNDPKKLRDLVKIYLTQADELIADLEKAIREKSPKDVEFAAHKLKGSSANCGMNAIVPPLRDLEQQGQEQRLQNPEALFAQVTAEYGRLKEFLADQVKPV